jgi:hypothetical protein
MDDLKNVCSNKIAEDKFQFKEESLMSAFIVAEKLSDENFKEKCLKIVKRFAMITVFYQLIFTSINN